MDTHHKAIRSSGWKTDILIGFPDGVLLLLFSTQVLHTKALTVQAFYMLHLLILGISTLLIMIAVFRANRGDEQHDEGSMSPEERRKLQNLDISSRTIEHIADEMERDQVLWEQTLESENVQLKYFRFLPAFRSMLTTGGFFFLGGLLAFFPYLMQEDFNAAAGISLTLSLMGLVGFALLKSRITGQRSVGMTLRYLALGGLVIFAAYLIGIAM